MFETNLMACLTKYFPQSLATAMLDTRCYQEINEGPCKAYMPRYAYKPSLGRCVRFIFGGCFGNDNNFKTRAQCERTCRRGSVIIIPKPEIVGPMPIVPDPEPQSVCMQPIESGRCLAYIPRYAFDANLGKCVKFIYGGCGGNGNNFETKNECRSACFAYIPMPIRL
ncbi:Kunitz/Bovine pancreatic trypsin inhibitor domain protein [Ancylostoma ceylanicum]|nr:Kunitz/Bovine pancreatic trypsin inhibitor domain protein [Ancylostoma ceylanicum]EYC08838.1 hypothetical protein Y032_0064g3558 [Ancylostoma ceylanicum]